MSAAVAHFRERQSRLTRRSRFYEGMRFAGEEAAFCLAEVKARLVFSDQLRRIEAERARRDRTIVAAMSPAERAVRLQTLHAQLGTLAYLPLGISAAERRRELEDELRSLAPEERGPFPDGAVDQ
jgi:hypothetical protein